MHGFFFKECKFAKQGQLKFICAIHVAIAAFRKNTDHQLKLNLGYN